MQVKKVCVFFSLLTMLLLIFACSSEEGSSSGDISENVDDIEEEEISVTGDGDKELTFMGHGNPTETDIFNELVSSYIERNPEVQVTYMSVPPGEYSQKLVTLAAAGNLPDVFYAAGPEFNRFVDADILLNLQPYLEATDTFQPENVWQEGLDRYRYDGDMSGQGDLYGLPKDLGPWAFVYNKELFDEEGIDYPSAVAGEWDWDDMLEAAEQLSKDTSGNGRIDQFGIADFSLESAVWANGGEFIDYDTGEIKIDEPEFYEAMQFVADLSNVYQVAPSVDDQESQNAYSRFVDGGIAMFAMGPWDQPAFWDLDFDWDIAAWPASPNTGETATWLGSMGYVIAENTEYPQEAFELASYLALDEEGQQINYELGQAIPNLIDMASDGYLNMEQPPANKQVFLDIIEDYGRPNIEWNSVDTEWLDTFHQEASRVWTGEETAEEWAADLQPRLQEMYDRAHE